MNLTDANSTEEALRDVDFCIHLAAVIDWGAKGQKWVYDTNVNLTQNVLDACRKNKVRGLLGTSSIECATEPNKVCLDVKEEQPVAQHPINAYPRSKIECEKRMLRADNPEGLRTAVMRPLAMYGPGQQLKMHVACIRWHCRGSVPVSRLHRQRQVWASRLSHWRR